MDPKLRAWIGQRLMAYPRAEFFSLYHSSVEGFGGNEPLFKHQVLEEKGSEEKDLDKEIDSIAEEVLEVSRQHCDAFDGQRQRYKLAAEDGANSVIATYLFNKGSKMRPGLLESGMSEPPTERGLMGALMRHLEATQQQVTVLTEAFVSPLIQENADLRRRQDQYEERRWDMWQKLEEVNSLAHARDLETKEFEIDQKRRSDFFDKLITHWGPEIIRKFQLPESKTACSPASADESAAVVKMQAALRDVLSILTSEERDRMLENFDSEKRVLFDSLIGFGKTPEKVSVFRGHLVELWSGLPDDLSSEIGETLLSRDKARAFTFLELLGVDVKKEDPS
mgnify:FL=1